MSAAFHSTPIAPDTMRVSSLDALRGLMALSVCIYHLSMWSRLFGPATAGGSLVTLLGVYSVEGFFIISGFCFFHQYRGVSFDWPELKRFHLRRFMRLAPLYYLAVALNLALKQAVGPAFTWLKLLENLSLTFGLVHPNHAMVLGGWSIGIEYVFYLAFPLLIGLARNSALLLLTTCVVAGAAIPWTFGRVEAAADWGRFHAYVQIPNHAFLFLVGAVIADLRRRVSLRLSVPLLVGLLTGLALLLIPGQPIIVDHVEAMVGFVRVKYVLVTSAVVLLVALSERGQRGPVRTGLLWLGDVSYSLYLLHPFAWLGVQTCLGDAATWPPAAALALLLALGMAGLTHRGLERPSSDWARRISRARPAPAARDVTTCSTARCTTVTGCPNCQTLA